LGTTENPFEVILELETPGNIWAISSPSEDWSVQQAAAGEAFVPGLRALARNEEQTAKPAVSTAGAPFERTTASLLPSPFLAQFMVGLNEQIRIIASDAARAAIAKQSGRLLGEFPTQLHDESKKILEQRNRRKYSPAED